MIPDNDPVRLLNACVEGMELSELYKTYTRVPKNLATPKQLFKIEANANKYTFLWKKAVSKNQARMLSKVAELIEVCEEVYGIRVAYNDRISLGTIKQLVLQLENSAVKKGSYL